MRRAALPHGYIGENTVVIQSATNNARIILEPQRTDPLPAHQGTAAQPNGWSEDLRTPSEGSSPPSTPISTRDLETVGELFSRIRIPWRIFLAHSLFQQITIPEIALTVSLSKRYAVNPKERMEATRAFLKTIILDGPDSPTGEAAIQRVNDVHREMGINPLGPAFSFVLYTLSHGLIESLRHNSSVAPSMDEELALFRFMRRVGEKMGASNIPLAYEEFVACNERFQAESWRARSNAPLEVARSIMENAFSRFPISIRPLVRSLALSLVGIEVLEQLHITPPNPLTRKVARAAIDLFM